MSEESPAPRRKANHIGAPACFRLELAVRQVLEAFTEGEEFIGCYLVGSAIERPDWRDVDVRMILSDELFAKHFPAVSGQQWEHDTKWLLLTAAISAWLSQVSGLPIDFQFQRQSSANRIHQGERHAIGFQVVVA